MRKNVHIRFAYIVASIIGIAALQSCAPKTLPRESAKFEASCDNDPNEYQKYERPILELPIPVHIDISWKTSEWEEIIASMENWNRVSQSLFDEAFFTLAPMQPHEPVYLHDIEKLHQFCDTGREGLWIIPDFAEYHWRDLGFEDVHLGATWRCSRGEDGHPPTAIVLVNRVEERGHVLGSIVLHELGHVLGLKHSCQDNHESVIGDRACSGPEKTGTHFMSVMEPNVYVTMTNHCQSKIIYTEKLNRLHEADLERIYCLYSKQIEPEKTPPPVSGPQYPRILDANQDE